MSRRLGGVESEMQVGCCDSSRQTINDARNAGHQPARQAFRHRPPPPIYISYLSALRCECQSLVPSFFASTCGPMVTPRRLSKYNPRNFNFNFDSLSSTTTDVRQRLARLNNRSLSQSRRFSEASENMATLLWGYLRVPIMFASGLGAVVSSGLYYYQKYVF